MEGSSHHIQCAASVMTSTTFPVHTTEHSALIVLEVTSGNGTLTFPEHVHVSRQMLWKVNYHYKI